jgi:hypothetical protein
MEIMQHISDDAIFRPKNNEVIRGLNVKIVRTGSPIGRFIFREWAPVMILRDISNVEVSECCFECDGGTFVSCQYGH